MKEIKFKEPAEEFGNIDLEMDDIIYYKLIIESFEEHNLKLRIKKGE